MKIVVAAASALWLLAVNLLASPQDEAFQKIAHDYVEQYLRANPEQATELGDHRFDGELTDYSAEAQAKDLATQKEFREKLNGVDGSQVSSANAIDLRILRENIDYEIFRAEELKEPEWNPLVYMQSLANSLYLLVARDFARADKRVANLRLRMEKIPGVIAQAKANLQHPPRVHTETAIEQTQGAINLVDAELAPLLDQAPQTKNELAPLQKKTAAALEEYKKWLQSDLLPRSDGNFRIGAEKYRKKLRFALASDLPMEEILKHAKADLEQTQTAIYETALPLYKKYFPDTDQQILADKHKVSVAVLDKLAEQHPNDATVVEYAKKVVTEATDFVKQHDLVSVPNMPLDVIAMPEFKRGVAIAYCDAPGPLEKNGKTFYAVAPTPKHWSKERKESFFREYNNYMIRDLTVHEAMPGHFLQLARSNEFRAPTLVRAIFQSGTFIEGWAVYCEQMMAEQAYDGPEVKMQQLKMRLRAICNAILDQSIHAGDMTEKEAMDLMTKQAYQQEGEAVAKWKRARLTSAQLSTYFVGATEHLDLRAAEQKKLGSDFNLRKYNDQVISYGSPPVKYVRELMLQGTAASQASD
ncbi:MAG TPA: DUF885 domain-containing protein [Candidatus Udaeobacter sp.]|nr:DUF885 domain-containing protein [Candidatus Udaeobacter sp.]